MLQNSLSQDSMDARNLCEFRKQQIILTEAGKKKYINGDTELQIVGRWGSSPPSVDVCLVNIFFILMSSLVIGYCWKQATLLDECLLWYKDSYFNTTLCFFLKKQICKASNGHCALTSSSCFRNSL